jgi:hypothetical protein
MNITTTLAIALPHNRQRGVSTLVVAIILLVSATFLTFFAAKVSMQETRMSANDYRHKQAFAWAETAMDRAKVGLTAYSENWADWDTAGLWVACSGATFPCGDGTTIHFDGTWWYIDIAADIDANALEDAAGNPLPGNPQAFLLTQEPDDATGVNVPVVLVGRATSDDATADAIVQQTVIKTSLLNSKTKVAPVVAPVVAITGALTVVTNPNGGSAETGVPLSVWADDPVDLGSAAVGTCQADQFRDSSGDRCIGITIPDPVTGNLPSWGQCGCDAFITKGGGVVSTKKVEDESWQGKDIVDYGEFPTDLFEYLFGIPRAQYADVQALAKPLTSCAGLDDTSTGVFWVTGECDITVNGLEVGSQTAPVILIVDGNIRFGGGSHIWGLVYEFNPSATVQISGTFNMHGPMISEADITAVAGGTFNSIYDPDVQIALTTSSGFTKYAPYPGSWNDGL